MSMVFQFILILALSVIELWAAIPAAFALGLPAPIIVVVVSIGAIAGIVVAAFAGDKVRERVLAKKNPTEKSGKKSKIIEIWEKYGVVGYGLIAPLIVGAFIGSVLGIALGVERTKLLVSMSAGAVLWIIILTLAISFGIDGVTSVVNTM